MNETWRAGRISEEEQAERDKGPGPFCECGAPVTDETKHACLQCAHVGCGSCMSKDTTGWFCGEDCQIQFLLGVIIEIEQDAEQRKAEIRAEIKKLRRTG